MNPVEPGIEEYGVWAEQEIDETPPSALSDDKLFVDVASLLAGGLPEPPRPVLLHRTDGNALFYAGKVNVLFGDPECGKTWIALAASVEALRDGRRVVIIDLDHNGAAEIVGRLLTLGALPKQLSDLSMFRIAEPEDKDNLLEIVRSLQSWRPAAAVVDSIGELLPMFGMSSNSPDDYTAVNRMVLTPIANAGTAVIAIDHMPKNNDARSHGQTGTMAKRRTVNGVALQVTLVDPFAPGRGGSASMTIWKDRPGGLRACSPTDGKTGPAGRFVMMARHDGTMNWQVTVPMVERENSDVAELCALDPSPRSKGDVMKRMNWGSDRAMRALREYRASLPGTPTVLGPPL